MVELTIIDKIKDDIKLMYYLYKIDKNDHYNMPNFINTGNLKNKLIKMGIIEFVSKKKHLHEKTIQTTKKGSLTIRFLKENKYFEPFDLISSIDNIETFEKKYYTILEKNKLKNELLRIQDNFYFLKHLINKRHNNDNLTFNIEIYIAGHEISKKITLKILHINELDNEISMKIQFFCPRCENTVFVEDLNLNEYNCYDQKKIKCDKCNANIIFTKNLERWYLLDGD